MEALIVTKAEAGQKLLNFLERRVENSPGDLHKWIRTGQVRRNGGRAKPFDRVEEGDTVRLPPFASLLQKKGEQLTVQEITTPSSYRTGRTARENQAARADRVGTNFSAKLGIPVVFEDADILTLNKPAGLPTQGGTGHADSVAARLTRCFAAADFTPAPAHRLDLETSGLLLIGKTYTALRALTDALAGRGGDALAGRGGDAPRKEYLAWVWGSWPHIEECELIDRLEKDDEARRMKTSQHDNVGREARCRVCPLQTRRIDGHAASLLLVRLLTGRTHQIRVQLATRGFPIIGDSRYGQGGEGLMLHAFRLVLPSFAGSGEPERVFTCFPPWEEPWWDSLTGVMDTL